MASEAEPPCHSRVDGAEGLLDVLVRDDLGAFPVKQLPRLVRRIVQLVPVRRADRMYTFFF